MKTLINSPQRTRILLLALVLALVGLLVWQAMAWRDNRADDKLRSEAVAVAKAQVIDLTTLDSESVESKLKALGGRTTGDFKSQISQISATFADVVRSSKIEASGVVDKAGVSDLDEQSATVLVASTSTVKSDGQKKPVVQTYRFKVTLDRTDDSWKIDGMEFVR